jgi:transcriptional regulator with XRE-family HTH domain
MLNSLDVHEINLLRRYMTQLHTFGTMLTSLRNQKGLTGVKLAKMSGISPVAMHYAEFGRKLLSEKTIRRLAEALCTPAFPLIQAAAQERGRVSIELDGQPESVKRILYVLASRNKPLSEATTRQIADMLEQADALETDAMDQARAA